VIVDLVRTVATYLATGSSAIVGPMVIVAGWKDPENADPLVRLWCESILRSANLREDVAGLENLPSGTCVFVCNHQSNFDAPFVFARIPRHIRFVAKQELYRIPIFGAALKAMGNIRVERTGVETDREAIQSAVERVQTKTSILFFAEGTRSIDGKLRPFKKGAAVLAIDAQVPLVPVAVAGAHQITPKGGLWVHSGRPIVLRVGKPIVTAGLGREDRDMLTARAHQAVAELLEEGDRRVREMEAHG
jgi:1-acyl-sn-glycerol-3-phosphate acyltransferase